MPYLHQDFLSLTLDYFVLLIGVSNNCCLYGGYTIGTQHCVHCMELWGRVSAVQGGVLKYIWMDGEYIDVIVCCWARGLSVKQSSTELTLLHNHACKSHFVSTCNKNTAIFYVFYAFVLWPAFSTPWYTYKRCPKGRTTHFDVSWSGLNLTQKNKNDPAGPAN